MLKYTILSLSLILTSCTLSFQNISTHGTTSEVADSDPSNELSASPNIELPLKALNYYVSRCFFV